MIKINLLPEAKVATRRLEAVSTPKSDNFANICIVILLVIGVVVTAGRWWTLNSKQKALSVQIKDAETELERLKPILEEVEKFKRKKELLQRKLNLINDLKANQKGPVHIMDQLSSTVPTYLWLENMDLKGNIITLRGGALNPNEVAEFIKNLDDSPYFEEPSLKSIRESQKYYAFDLTFTFTFNPKTNKDEKQGG